MLSAGIVQLCVDARLLFEYDQALRRRRFGFRPDAVAALMDYIESSSEIAAGAPLGARLPDADDEASLEVAIACRVDYLLTGNLAHFSVTARAGVRVVLPADFIEAYRLAG